ncbi:ATP-dependent nuclease [Nostoc sp.]|uniref:ATP-dependent nuclease n=1 Tax=Nostoc sp. TaxID=1180 RepID=UPI002FFC9686
MFIKKLQVFNYKSYLDSGLIEFAPGINIIVGQNNAGKTALLEALTLQFNNQPHLSIKKLPDETSVIQEESIVQVTLCITKEEIWNVLKQASETQLGFPQPIIGIADEYYHAHDNGYELKIRDVFDKLKNYLSNIDKIDVDLYINHSFQINKSTNIRQLLNFGLYDINEKAQYTFFKIKYDHAKGIFLNSKFDYETEEYHLVLDEYEGGIKDSIGYHIIKRFFINRVYRFYAERLNLGFCSFENNTELKPDASNLAEVLSILQGGNPRLFKRFNDYISIVLPQIKRISIRHRDKSTLEIMVYPIDPSKTERDDLSFPLSSCGSGVSQVLAILYVLINSKYPRTLIIDEPQSFLHPGAAKKLIEILREKEFSHHQYFIATHSPEIIVTANPSNIIKLKYQDGETTATVINTIDIKSQNDILAELGVRLSDVFGADSILWVEGQTEEKCFPLILEKFAKITLMGIKILSVHSTDALLDGKRYDLVFDIYKKLTTGANLFPPAIGFIFDRESKTETKIQELEKRGVTFLRLPMYENYLLHPEAISVIINEEATWLETPISIIQIQEYLDKIKQENSYLLQGAKREEVSVNWLSKIHGAKILESIFQELCDNKLQFRKTKHSYKLTEWLVENKPDFLSELAEELKDSLNKSQ